MKRIRHHSLAAGSMQSTFGLPQVPECYSALDILAEIRKIGANAITRSYLQLQAMKDDIKIIDNKLVAQTTEISQLSQELEQQAKRLKEVEAKVGNQTPQPEMTRLNVNSDGARQAPDPDTRKYNVVFEGVPKEQND